MSKIFTSSGQSIGASALASVFPMNIQGWFPLELTSLTSLQSQGLSKVLSNTTIWKHQFFSTQPSYGTTLTSVHDCWKIYSFDYKDFVSWGCYIFWPCEDQEYFLFNIWASLHKWSILYWIRLAVSFMEWLCSILVHKNIW